METEAVSVASGGAGGFKWDWLLTEGSSGSDGNIQELDSDDKILKQNSQLSPFLEMWSHCVAQANLKLTLAF